MRAIFHKLLHYLVLILILLSSSFAFAKEDKKAADYIPPNIQNPALKTHFDDLKKACSDSHTRAQKMCLQEWSPSLRGATETITPLITVLNSAGSMMDVCSGFAKISRIAQTGMLTYKAECGFFQSRCDSACGRLLILEQELSSAVETCTVTEVKIDGLSFTFNDKDECLKDMATIGRDVKHDRKSVGSSAYAMDTCAEYATNLTLAAADLMALVLSKKSAQSCQDETSVAGLDCTKSENKQMAECICLSNPRSPGCSANSLLSNINQGKLQNSAFNGIDGTEDTPITGGGPGAGSDSGSDIQGNSVSGVSAPGSGSPPGVPGGGGGGGGSSGSSGSASGSRYKVMAIGEEGGGGGGGGFRGSSSRSSREPSAYDSKYAAYLPGGKNDPLKNADASGISGPSEITGVGGKSNWDKVRERYNDNRYKMIRD